MNKQKLREAATDLSKTAMELIQEILIKHDMALLEECKDMIDEKRMIHIGYAHPYGIEQLPIYAERGEKWNTPVSSTPFDGAIKVYVEAV
jgi:hypothetical protein